MLIAGYDLDDVRISDLVSCQSLAAARSESSAYAIRNVRGPRVRLASFPIEDPIRHEPPHSRYDSTVVHTGPHDPRLLPLGSTAVRSGSGSQADDPGGRPSHRHQLI